MQDKEGVDFGYYFSVKYSQKFASQSRGRGRGGTRGRGDRGGGRGGRGRGGGETTDLVDDSERAKNLHKHEKHSLANVKGSEHKLATIYQFLHKYLKQKYD